MFDVNFVLLAWTFCILLVIFISLKRFWFIFPLYFILFLTLVDLYYS